LKQAFGVDSKMIPGSGGIFDVVVDGEKVFSKHSVGRFPDPGEVTRLLERRTP
jgi:selenoprotein W-related protein